MNEILFELPPHLHTEPSTPTLTKKVEIGRNDPCYCGSGKKYKKCCLLKDFHTEQETKVQEDLECTQWLENDIAEGRQNLIAMGETPPC